MLIAVKIFLTLVDVELLEGSSAREGVVEFSYS